MMRILVVGQGSIGKRHLSVCRQCFPEAELFALPSRAGSAPSEIGADFSLLENIQQAVDTSISLAIIATPAHHRDRFLLPLTEAGVPVLVEKPLTHSRAAAERLVNQTPTEAVVGVAYQFRFSPTILKLKSYLEQGALGKLLHVQIVTGQYLPDWRPGMDYRQSVSAQKNLGGGVIRELSHELDLLLWLLGEPSSVCAAVSNSGSLDIDTEDQMDAVLRMANGATVNLHLDMLQHSPQRYWLLTGSEGSLKVDLIQQQVEWHSSTLHTDEVVSLGIERDQLFARQLRHFVDFADGKEPWCGATLKDGIKTLKLVEAIETAGEQQRWLDFNEYS